MAIVGTVGGLALRPLFGLTQPEADGRGLLTRVC